MIHILCENQREGTVNNIGNLNTSGDYPKAQIGQAPEGAPTIHVTAHIDATEGTIEPFMAGRLDAFEKAKSEAGSGLEVSAELYRAGVTPKQKIMSGLKWLGAHVALPAIGAAFFGIPGLAVGLAIDAGLFALGVTRQALGSLASGAMHRKSFPEPDWKGKKTYEITADKTPGFDSKVTSEDPAALKMKPEEFGDFTEKNLRKYPSSTTEVEFFAGHGMGYRSMTSMRVKDIAAQLERAENNAGKKPGVILAESCLMGNMEALNEFVGKAKVAVFSEETLGATALPLQEMLKDAAEKGGTPEEIGARMVKIAGATGQVQTLTAFNLDKLPKLNEAIDNLGKNLLVELGAGKQKDLQKAMKGAMKFPQGKMMFLERKVLKFSDLGGFLAGIQEKDLTPQTKAAAKEAEAALNDAIIERYTSSSYKKASGLSIQAKPKSLLMDLNPEMGHSEDASMPDSWKSFIKLLWQKPAK
jgi:hypothetical protein